MANARLFVAMTNLQLLAIDDIRARLGPADGPEILLTFGGRAEGEGMSPFQEVLRYYPDSATRWQKLRSIGTIRRALDTAIDRCAGHDSVDVFYAHENHVVTNYLVNQLAGRLSFGTRIRYHVIPDGTLNLSSYRVDWRMWVRNVARKVLMRMVGMDFQLLRGEVLSDRLNHVTWYFTYSPALAWSPQEKIVELRHRRRLTLSPDPSVALVLGQPLEYSVSRRLAIELAQGLQRHLLGHCSYRAVFYRGHQFPAAMDGVFLDGSETVLEAPRGATIEEMVASGMIRARDIYSFSSSALQNLMMFFPGAFRTYAYGLEHLMAYDRLNHKMHDDIRRAFVAFGVTMIAHRR